MTLVKILILAAFTFVCNILLAQNVISGKILDYDTGNPIIGANVFRYTSLKFK